MTKTIELQLGIACIPVVAGSGNQIKEKVAELRKKMKEKNIDLPLIHVYEDPNIHPFNEIRIIVDKEIVLRKEIRIREEEKREQFASTIDQMVEAIAIVAEKTV